MQIPVQLAEAPINAVPARRVEASRAPGDRLGIKVKVLDQETAAEMGFPKAGGVVLSEVAPGSAAYEHKLGSGEDVRPLKVVQIDRKAVATPDVKDRYAEIGADVFVSSPEVNVAMRSE